MPNYYNSLILPNIYRELANNLVVLYDFSGSGSTTSIVDLSGNDYNGTLTNAGSPTDSWTNGGIGGLDLDGSNDYIDLCSYFSSFNALTEGSIECWVYVNDDYSTIFSLQEPNTSQANQFMLIISSNGYLRIYHSQGGSIILYPVLEDQDYTGQLLHIVYTVNSSGNKIYVNKVDRYSDITYNNGSAESTYFLNNLNNVSTSYLGCFDGYSTSKLSFYDGILYKFAIYDIALTQDQITSIYDYERIRMGITHSDRGITEGVVYDQ